MSAILDHGPVARSTVARLTGLSPAAVTGHVGQLLARGLVREGAETAGPKGLGRPHIPVEIDTGRYLVAGAHVAVAHSTVSLMDLRGRIVAEDRQPHAVGARGPYATVPGGSPRGLATGPALLRDLADRLPRLVDAHAEGRTVLALGFATGHRVDPAAGVVVDHPHLGWRDVPVREILQAATGLPVHVDSHSRALARAEQLFGETSTRASTVLLFVGAVVDAAFASSGSLHLGPRSGAGSVAHLPLGSGGSGGAEPCSCGRTGCLQTEVSERAGGPAVRPRRALLESARGRLADRPLPQGRRAAGLQPRRTPGRPVRHRRTGERRQAGSGGRARRPRRGGRTHPRPTRPGLRAGAPGRHLGDHRAAHLRAAGEPARRRQGEAEPGRPRPDRRDRPARRQPVGARRRLHPGGPHRRLPAPPFGLTARGAGRGH
ncbi:transcriptional regulator [Streptomyces filamentosus NRRL 11379]|nr:transcriptional regulator [Streptomyces filamentosus NRRL 11379]